MGESQIGILIRENINLKEIIEKLKQYIKAYKQSEQKSRKIIAELKAENEKLKKEIKNNKSAYQVELGTYNMECGNLLEENKELAHYLACMTEQRNKANTCLQKIKKYIAKICKEECGYVQKKRCPDCDCRYGAILDLITKTEEE